MRKKPTASKAADSNTSDFVSEKPFRSVLTKDDYDWGSDEGLDLDIDSTPYAYLDPRRASSAGIMNVGNSLFFDKASAGGLNELDSVVPERGSRCFFVKSLPWWLAYLLKLFLISAVLLICPLVIIHLKGANSDHDACAFIPGSYALWSDRIFPVIIYIEVCIVSWMFGKLFYSLLLRRAHHYIVSKPTAYTTDTSRSLCSRVFGSSKFHILLASSHVIFFTLYTGLLLLLYTMCFNVPKLQSPDSEWLSTANLLYFGYRTLIILLVGCVFYSVQKLFIANIIGNFYQTAYSDRLRDYSFAFQAIKKLYEHSTEETDAKVRKIYLERHPDVDLEKKHQAHPIQIPASYSQIHYILINSLQEDDFIDSRKAAKNSARLIFEHFYPGDQAIFNPIIASSGAPFVPAKRSHHRQHSGQVQQHVHRRPTITPGSLLKRNDLGGVFTDADLVKVFRIFDINNNESVRPTEMKIALVSLSMERSRLIKSLSDHGRAVSKLDTISLVAACVLTIVLAPTLLGYPLKGLESIVAFLLSCKFMFSDSISHLLQSVIFLFVTHPFDVGDRVFINSEVLFVHEMGLFCTIFHRFDSHLIYYPNAALYDQHIVNVRRSGNMTEWIDLVVDMSTPKNKLRALNERMSEFILSESREFETEIDHLNNNNNPQKGPQNALFAGDVPDKAKNAQFFNNIIELRGLEIANCNLLRLGITLRHKSNFQDGVIRTNRHYKFMNALQEALIELQINYYPPTMRIDFVH